jgi:hypothetical protein
VRRELVVMPLLDFRRPKIVIIKEVVSYTGKYTLFYGHHFVKGHTCYDVGTINKTNGEIITRHYLDQGRGNPKSEALACYHEMEKGLTRKPTHEEELEENNPRKADAFRRALTQRPGKS